MECKCGCTEHPRGKYSPFCPGHDSKHRSNLLRRVDEDADWSAANELVELEWLTVPAAVARLATALTQLSRDRVGSVERS